MTRTRRSAILLGVLGALGVLSVAGALFAAGLGSRPAALPPGWSAPTVLPASQALPRDVVVFDSDRTGNFEIFTIAGPGGQVVQITDDPAYDSWSPRISPDRRTILVHRAPAGIHDLDHSKVSIWAVSADGGQSVQLRPPGLDGWALQGHAEWSPDGRSLVMFGGSRISPQIHVTDNLGQKPRAVTARGGVNLDPSFSPDGRQIAFVGCPRAVCVESNYEIYRIPVSGGKVTRVTSDSVRDHDPYWSPDGTRLAWLTAFGGPGVGVWDVRIGDAQGRNPTRLFGDSGVTSRPAFSPDSRYVYVHRIPPGGAKFDVFRVALDGSGVVGVTVGQPGNNEYPSP